MYFLLLLFALLTYLKYTKSQDIMEFIQLGHWVNVNHVNKDVSNKSWQRIWNEFPRMINLKLLQRFEIRDLS